MAINDGNLARFTINGTPSEDASGNRGYDTTAGSALAITLERNPAAGALTVFYELPDAAREDAPLSSMYDTQQEFTQNTDSNILLTQPNDTVNITINPATDISSYTLRCTVVAPEGTYIYERLIVVRKSGLRMTIPSESQQYGARGWSDAMNELTKAVADGGIVVPLVTDSAVGTVAAYPTGVTRVLTSDGTTPGGVWSDGVLPGGASDGDKVAFANSAGTGIAFADAVKMANPAGAQDGLIFGGDPAASGTLRFSPTDTLKIKFSTGDITVVSWESNSLVIGEGTVGHQYLIMQVNTGQFLFRFTGVAGAPYWELTTGTWRAPKNQSSFGIGCITRDVDGDGSNFSFAAGNALDSGAVDRKGGGFSFTCTDGVNNGDGGDWTVNLGDAPGTGDEGYWLLQGSVAIIKAQVDSNGPYVALGTGYSDEGILRIPPDKYISSDYSAGINPVYLIGWETTGGGAPDNRLRIGTPGGPCEPMLFSTSGYIYIGASSFLTGGKSTGTHLQVGPGVVQAYNHNAAFNFGFGSAHASGNGEDLQFYAQDALQSGGTPYDGGDAVLYGGNRWSTGAYGKVVIKTGGFSGNHKIAQFAYEPSGGSSKWVLEFTNAYQHSTYIRFGDPPSANMPGSNLYITGAKGGASSGGGDGGDIFLQGGQGGDYATVNGTGGDVIAQGGLIGTGGSGGGYGWFLVKTPTGGNIIFSAGFDGSLNPALSFYQGTPRAQASVGTLNDQTTGTATSTIGALTDPADSPATADALRDDLVANLIPEIRDNQASLAGRINDIIDALGTTNGVSLVNDS